MPTPKDGVVKTDLETYPETPAGNTQLRTERILTKLVDADNHTFLPEIFKNASVETKTTCVCWICSTIFSKRGILESSWRHRMYVMLPKSGHLSETNNGRPIAI